MNTDSLSRGRPAATSPESAPGTPVEAAGSETRPHILVLALWDEDFLSDMFEHLMSSIKAVARLSRATTAPTAFSLLQSKPSAVLVIDSAISKLENVALLNKLVEYANNGGTVVLSCNFSNHFSLGPAAKQIFQRWGSPWEDADYSRETAILASGTVPGMDIAHLVPSYSVKALRVKNFSPTDTAVYRASNLEDEAHAAFMSIGQGYLGYIGDVNAEEPTTKLTLAMLHLPIDHVQKDTRDRSIGVTIGPASFAWLQRPGSAGTGNTNSIPKPSSSSARNKHTVKTQPLRNEDNGEKQGESRPREIEVIMRRHQREKRIAKKKAKADKLKDEGNIKFRAGEWEAAAKLYKLAAKTYKPLPVYMSNLAAALLKLERFEEAKLVATHATVGDPTMVKAHFRRGQARKATNNYAGAIRDFGRCLAIDRGSGEAMMAMLTLNDSNEQHGWSGSDSGEADTAFSGSSSSEEDDDSADEKSDDDTVLSALSHQPILAYRVPGITSHLLDCPSDTEEYQHKGNDRACRYYNHDGCRFGTACRYKHAADKSSIRDELGRNVCLHFLIHRCHFGSRCSYAHDTGYLPCDGWWIDPCAVYTYRRLYDIAKAKGEKDVLKGWLGREMNGRAMPWENLDRRADRRKVRDFDGVPLPWTSKRKARKEHWDTLIEELAQEAIADMVYEMAGN